VSIAADIGRGIAYGAILAASAALIALLYEMGRDCGRRGEPLALCVLDTIVRAGLMAGVCGMLAAMGGNSPWQWASAAFTACFVAMLFGSRVAAAEYRKTADDGRRHS
jgi:MFS family permease